MSAESAIELPPGYDTLHVGIALYDPETATILAANQRAEDIFGYPIDALRDLPVTRYTANTYSFSESQFGNRLSAAAEGSRQEFVWRVKRADGELIWVRVYLSRESRNGPVYVRAELRDITADYNTRHREELFWRLLRHNLRNKANVISGHAREITTTATEQGIQTDAERIQTVAMELGEIADSVREIQQAVDRSESGRRRHRATAAVRDVVDELLEAYPDVEIAVTEREEMWIDVDRAFAHALTHAIENAIVHSDDGTPTVEVIIGPSANTGRVEIRIEDRNPVIEDVELDALFHHEDTTSLSHGSGVGLFVMKWCIESLGGEIRFERRDPRGNTVRFYLPSKTLPTDGS